MAVEVKRLCLKHLSFRVASRDFSMFTNQDVLCCMRTFLLLYPFSTCVYLYFSLMSCAWETVWHSSKNTVGTFLLQELDLQKLCGYALSLSCNRIMQIMPYMVLSQRANGVPQPPDKGLKEMRTKRDFVVNTF